MDFSFTEEQEMLRDSVDRFLTNTYDLRTRQETLGDQAKQAALWQNFAELGLIGAAFPEEVGGFSSSATDTGVIMERFGRHLVAEPFLITAVLCGQILLNTLPDDQKAETLEPVISGERHWALMACGNTVLSHTDVTTITYNETGKETGGSITLNGGMSAVLNGDRADHFIVAARTEGQDGVTLFRLDADAAGVKRTPFRLLDGSGAASVELSDVTIDASARLTAPGVGEPVLNAATDHAIAALCWEAVGSMDHLVTSTSEYIRTRVQYDQPLSKFQVLKHRMSDSFIKTETARTMACIASIALDSGAEQARLNIAAAKAQIGTSAEFVGYQAVQLHGGMGVSEELDIGHHYMRLTLIDRMFGDVSHQLARYTTISEDLVARLGPGALMLNA